MKIYLYLAQVVLAVALITLVTLQAKDAGLSQMFGGGDLGVGRTRRGVEKTMFQATIALGVLFILLAIATVRVAG
ncbi:MAG: preprotein translocase subunit SecG [Anaerolineae bacterium]|nr:preprotein translocase subunit SecG [Anaerolineae bacterium]